MSISESSMTVLRIVQMIPDSYSSIAPRSFEAHGTDIVSIARGKNTGGHAPGLKSRDSGSRQSSAVVKIQDRLIDD